ncbi:hypothetical protein Hanom_Chr06g00566321 [Helianthus anomalus]
MTRQTKSRGRRGNCHFYSIPSLPQRVTNIIHLVPPYVSTILHIHTPKSGIRLDTRSVNLSMANQMKDYY